MFRKHVKQHEIGLLFRRGDFRRLLGPGDWFLPRTVLGSDQLKLVDTLETRFEHRLLDVLVQHAPVRERLLIVELAEDQRALVWRDDRLFEVVGPGRHAYWQQPFALRIETFRESDVRFEHPRLNAVLSHPAARALLSSIDVQPHQRLLVRRGGELVADLGPGRHAFWNRAAAIAWQHVELREQIADVAGQEIMTADKVTLRLNLVVTWKVIDPVAATTVVENAAAAVYREAQLALRAAVGARDLETLLTSKDAVADEVRAAVARRAGEYGTAVTGVGIRDVVLPGDMKTILNQVIEAQKQAEANLIRRREETAAARSQANTARLLAENPVLLRMKELEALEAILRGAKASFVFAPGNLGDQVRSMITSLES